MKQFISVDEARQQILDRLPRLGRERVMLTAALGRVLAESIEAPEDSPRFDNSARDGYALRFDDLEGDRPTLDIVGEAAAGGVADFEVGPNQAGRIMTGAALPAGADTVVMQEHCEVDQAAGTVTVVETPAAGRGAWVRHAGENMARGEAVLEPGATLQGADIGLLAGFRRSTIEVSRRPTVAIVSTGDELVEIDQTPGPGQIINSNAYMLEALVSGAGAEPLVLPVVADQNDAVARAFGRAIAEADIVISSGGVSVGTYDVTLTVVDELTGGMDFWKIRMKPGKPLAFGLGGTQERVVPIIGLPGNPNSCLVCFHQFVRPALAVMQGQPAADVAPTRIQAILANAVETTPRRRTYLSGTLSDGEAEAPVFTAADNQNSGNLQLFCQANALGLVEEGVARLEAGAAITVELLPH
ncbi:MAG: gephyrin-like molybdotransferase Glp [Persicimonas sp.]